MKILEIGPNQNPQAHLIPGWEKAEIITLDADPEQHPDIVCDARQLPAELEGTLDGIFASHVLEHFTYWETRYVLAGWVNYLKDGGSLHVVVPSLEWAARQILAEHPSPAVLPHLFAGHVSEWDHHLTGFTMRLLRREFEALGLSVFRARTGLYKIQVNGQLFDAEQHYIAGLKGMPGLQKE